MPNINLLNTYHTQSTASIQVNSSRAQKSIQFQQQDLQITQGVCGRSNKRCILEPNSVYLPSFRNESLYQGGCIDNSSSQTRRRGGLILSSIRKISSVFHLKKEKKIILGFRDTDGESWKQQSTEKMATYLATQSLSHQKRTLQFILLCLSTQMPVHYLQHLSFCWLEGNEKLSLIHCNFSISSLSESDSNTFNGKKLQ